MERIRKALTEPILRPVDAKAPVARALVEVTFSLEHCVFDAQRLESLRYEQSYRTCANDQDMKTRLVRRRHGSESMESLRINSGRKIDGKQSC